MKKFLALAATAAAFSAAPAFAADDQTIAEVAMANPDFSTLVAAVKAAGLVEALKTDGPVTVFAPTNDAFDKLGKDKVEALLKDKEMLTKVLKAHIVKGKVMAADAMKMDGRKVNGFLVKAGPDAVMIGSAKVTKADIRASNGVIHVIDTVLVPAAE